MSGYGTTEIEAEYVIPDGYKLYALPENRDFKHKKFNAVFKYSVSGNILKVYSKIRIQGYRIDVKEYLSFRKFAQFINKKELEPVVLIKAGKRQ